MYNGWIFIHHKMLEWEWYSNSDVVRVFLHLLLKANWKESKWNGITLNPGQLVTGRKILAKDLGLGEQTIRTVLTRLKSTSEITIKNYSKFSLITLNNWHKYQSTNQQTNQHLTSNQPATNHSLIRKEGKKTLSKDKEATPRPPKGIILLKDEPTTMSEQIDHSFPRSRLYGDEKINWLLDYAEFKLGAKFAGQERWNRIYARHLANKVGMGKCKDLMDSSLVPENWWFDKITQMSSLYKNWDRITAFAVTPKEPVNNLEEMRKQKEELFYQEHGYYPPK